MQFVVICISVSRQASPLLNLPLHFLFLYLPTTESSLSPPCCLTSYVTCPSSTKPWVILGNQFSPSFTLRRGCRAGVHSLWQPNPRKVPQGQTSVRVLVQTRFCGEWNLESQIPNSALCRSLFAINTTHKAQRNIQLFQARRVLESSGPKGHIYRVFFFTGPAQKSSEYGTGPTQ